MNRTGGYVAIVTVSLCTISCASPQLQTPATVSAEVAREAELQRKYLLDLEKEQRIMLGRTEYKLARAAAELCGTRLVGAGGFWTWSAKEYPDETADIARRYYGLDDGLTVLDVFEDSSAYRSGLRAGDRIVSMTGVAVPAVTGDLIAMIEANAKTAFTNKEPISIEVERGGERQTLSLSLEAACGYEAALNRDSAINAFADGERIFVNTGMMNFVRSEKELALVLAHELSHNFLGHVSAQRRNTIVGGGLGLVLDVIIGASTGVTPGLSRAGAALAQRAHSIQFEQEADYAGLYLMRRAGYDLTGVAEFWRRIAAQDARQISLRSTHPTSAERFVAIETALKEIETKERAGQPLVPNFKAPVNE
jgi:Zn-dependent protease with chaperone function